MKLLGFYPARHKSLYGNLIFLLLATLIVFVSFETRADYYKYLSEDGVECYTDSPGKKKAALVLRDSRTKTIHKKAHTTPPLVSTKTRLTLPKERSRNLKTLGLPVGGIITSTVGIRHDPIDGLLRQHKGIDIAVPEGTQVKPVASGVVAFSGARNGYGNMVIVEHDDGMVTIYAHHRTNLAKMGERVDRGSIIALSGSTGRSTGPHLHFEAWYGNENITPEFTGGKALKSYYAPTVHKFRRTDSIRRIAMADGSILFTNLPYTHP